MFQQTKRTHSTVKCLRIATSGYRWYAYLGLLAVVLLLTVPDLGAAELHEYQIDGISCVPGSQTLGAENHHTLWGKVTYQPGESGQLILFCPVTFAPVPRSAGQLMRLTVLLHDADGTGTGDRVTVALKRLRRSSGSVSTHPEARLVSNTDCSNQSGWQECSVVSTVPRHLPFENYYYFFQVNMNRANPDARNNVALGGIRLDYVTEVEPEPELCKATIRDCENGPVPGQCNWSAIVECSSCDPWIEPGVLISCEPIP